MLKPIAAALTLFIAACATTPPAAPGPEAMRGCWIDRLAGGGAKTMRWFPDGAAWRGEAAFYAGDGTNRSSALRLERAGQGWRICTVASDAPLESSCAPAWFGRAPSGQTGAWSEIYAAGDRLKMTAKSAGGASRAIIDAARDGCD